MISDDDNDRKNKKEKSILDMLRAKKEHEDLEQGKDPKVIKFTPIPFTDGNLPIDHPKNKAALDAFHQNETEKRPGDTLGSFLSNMNGDPLPSGWRDTPIGKRAYNCGFDAGYDKGIQAAWQEANAVIDPIRSILRLHDRSYDDHFDE